ncbi:bryoporin-like isoform X1 [Cyprinus carpio]|nr:bryoporin-like isoform X1 [Cyprinus carpio]
MSVSVIHPPLCSSTLKQRSSKPSILSAAATSTSRSSANMQNAEAVSATINTNRNCTVEITNVSSIYCLINPKVYMSSGFSYHPPQPTIRTAKTEVCSFTKDDNTATGAVGILTYDLFHMQNRMSTERMAILFSVPFDYHLYKNVMGIGLFESSRGCDKALYKHMYEGKDFSQFTRADAGGSGIIHKAKKIDLRATMSTVGKAIIKLEVYDKMG